MVFSPVIPVWFKQDNFRNYHIMFMKQNTFSIRLFAFKTDHTAVDNAWKGNRQYWTGSLTELFIYLHKSIIIDR